MSGILCIEWVVFIPLATWFRSTSFPSAALCHNCSNNWSWVWCPKSEVLMELTFACKWIYWEHFQSRIVQHENWLHIWVHGHDYLMEYRSEQKGPKLQILRCSFVQKRWKNLHAQKNLPFFKKNTCSCLTVSTSFSELNWDRPQEEEEKEDQ